MKKFYTIVCFLFFGICLVTAQERNESKESKDKAIELEGMVIKNEKKAIIQKADRTIFDFESQAHLNSGSVLEGIKKLPGLIVSDIAGMVYQGKPLAVYLDGRPLHISSTELNSFLESMPANSIEKIEVITQPGAEFPATSGAAIMNIITNKNAKNYLSATYSSGLEFTNYDVFRSRFNNNLMLSAKNKYFGWQFNVGQNYRENALWSTVLNQNMNSQTILSDSYANRITRMTFAKSAVTFDFKKDRLLLNYDVNLGNNTSDVLASGLGFVSNDFSATKNQMQEAVATYQKRFENPSKKLDFRFNYSKNKTDFDLDSRISNNAVLENSALQEYLNFKVDYNQDLKILDKGKISTGINIDQLNFETASFGTNNLDYSRKTTAAYFEVQTSLKKVDFILGSRAEKYLISGTSLGVALNTFNQFRVFPNATVQYNLSKQVAFNLNYSKKISLPSTTLLNPNNTNYQNKNVTFSGNPELEPTIYDNFGAKFSAFNYAFVGYNLSTKQNQVVTRVLASNNTVTNTSINVPEIKVHNFNFGLPIPYILFTKGLAETVKFNFNPDKIDFLYLYSGYQIHQIPNLETKGFWFFNFMSQIVLPKDIKFIANYNFNTTGGNYEYFVVQESFRKSLDITFSKKFLDDQLSLSIHIDDLFNQNRQALGPAGTLLSLQARSDSRRFGFNVVYKIPTRNKLAKTEMNLLNKEKKEDSMLIGN